ncbi:MAG: aminotransferase class IV [Actinomycetota bacterium]|nr:aminotransferase class IV [Actinomycetota bacterium]
MIWWGTLNGGELLEDSARPISYLDRGFLVGEGVFETLVVHSGVPFALTRHLYRLERSSQILGLPTLNLDVIKAAIADVIDANRTSVGELARLRITLTSGDGQPSLLVTLTAQAAWPETTSVITVPWVRNERSAIVGAKTTSYAENVAALAAVHARGVSEALMANTQGLLCEGTASNVFVVVNGQIQTPSLSSGCLPGVTRSLVLEWFGGIEAELPYEVLQSADEIFLTSSTREVHPVELLDDRRLDVRPVGTDLRARFVELRKSKVDP